MLAAVPSRPCWSTVAPPTPVTAAAGEPKILTSVLPAGGAGPVQGLAGQKAWQLLEALQEIWIDFGLVRVTIHEQFHAARTDVTGLQHGTAACTSACSVRLYWCT